MPPRSRRLKKNPAGAKREPSGPEAQTKQHKRYERSAMKPETKSREKDSPGPGFELECRTCGTVIEFLTLKCPICGTSFDIEASGLAELLTGLSFEDDQSPEEVCPACGETVHLETDTCPQCGEAVRSGENKVLPVEVGDKVVFMHLDVMTGEISCLRRTCAEAGFEHAHLTLDGRIRVVHGSDREGASEA